MNDSQNCSANGISIIEQTHPLSQFPVQSQRYQVLLLLDLLMSKYRSAIHEMQKTTPDFLPRFIAYFDGEKDPRNLMVVFSILAVVMTEWEISSVAKTCLMQHLTTSPLLFGHHQMIHTRLQLRISKTD